MFRPEHFSVLDKQYGDKTGLTLFFRRVRMQNSSGRPQARLFSSQELVVVANS